MASLGTCSVSAEVVLSTPELPPLSCQQVCHRIPSIHCSTLLSGGSQKSQICLLTRVIRIELLYGARHGHRGTPCALHTSHYPVYLHSPYGVPLLQSCEIGMQCRHAVHSWRLIFSGPEAVLARAPCLFRSLPPLSVFSFARILHCFLPTGVTAAVRAATKT